MKNDPLWDMMKTIGIKKSKVRLMQSEVNHLTYIREIVDKAINSDDRNVSDSGKEYYRQWRDGHLADSELICHISELIKEDASFYFLATYLENLFATKSLEEK